MGIKKVRPNISMAELLAKVGARAGSFFVGQKVKGKVISKNSSSVAIDIGGKSEGIVAQKAFLEAKNFIKDLKVGDEVEAVVLVPETSDGFTLLSLREAVNKAFWDRLQKAKDEKSPCLVLGKGANPSGVIIEIDGNQGFIPTSHLGKEACQNPQSLIGKYFKVQVIEALEASNKIVLSEKAVSDAEDIKLIRKALSRIKVGDIYEGVVTTTTPFGCFVRIEVDATDKSEGGRIPLEGLVHISELSWTKVENTEAIVKENDRVKVKVIGVKGGEGREDRLSFSIKQTQEDPWLDLEERYAPEAKISGRVVKVTEFGTFVEVEPGVEGLIHITKIPPGVRFLSGEKVDCFVEQIDTKAKRLSLGLLLTQKPVGYK